MAVIIGATSKLTIIIIHVRGLITPLPLNPKIPTEPFKGTLKGTPMTPLITTHEDSKESMEGSGVERAFAFSDAGSRSLELRHLEPQR